MPLLKNIVFCSILFDSTIRTLSENHTFRVVSFRERAPIGALMDIPERAHVDGPGGGAFDGNSRCSSI